MRPDREENTDKIWTEVAELVAQALELKAEARLAFIEAAWVSPEVRAEAASLVSAVAAKGSKAQLLDQGLPNLEEVIAASSEIEPSSPLIGRQFGAYVVERELGHGGMGLVLQARRADNLYERTVAIKVVQSTLAREEFTRRFRREMRILARLEHPAIVALVDAGMTEDGQPFLVMEYVDGVPIHLYAEREALTVPHLLDLVITLCDALSHAHAQGVIHRDIKPSNVLVNARSELKLLDFGIARLAGSDAPSAEQTSTQFRAVTPSYASPEQIAGETVTFRSDIYSAGVLLYRLLTGKPPFQLAGLSTAEIERVLRLTQPALPSIAGRDRLPPGQGPAYDAVVGRAMDQDPGRRYNSIAELKADLIRLRSNEVPHASPGRYYALRWWRAHAAAVGRVAVAGVVLAGLAAGATWLHHQRRVLPPTTATSIARVSLAVVPVRDSGKTTSLEAAVQEGLAAELSSGDQIRVVPATSVSQAMRDLQFGATASLSTQQTAQLGGLLGVDYLLEQRVRPRSNVQNGGVPLQVETRLLRVRGQQQLAEQSRETTADGLAMATQQIAVDTARLLPLKRNFTASPSLLPHGAEAVRFYAQGLEDLQMLEPVRAQPALSKAAALEPGSPLVHIALARTWDMLGYRQRAVDEAGRSIELTGGLPVRTKLVVEAQANETRRQWAAAIKAYGTLRDYDPDDIEYVLGLARSQLAINDGQAALKTLQAAASMPSLLGADPRIELLISMVHESMGEHKEALRSAEEVYRASQERNATQLMAQAQATRASALEALARVDEGLAAAQQAEALFASAGDAKGRAGMLISTGNFLEDHGRNLEAKTVYSQAHDIFARVGDEDRLGVAVNDLGIIASDLGNPKESLAEYTHALEIFRRVGDLPRVAAELNNIGTVQKDLGDVAAAQASYVASLEILKQLHDEQQVARANYNLGVLLLGHDRLDEAEGHYADAYALYSKHGEIANALRPLQGLAHVAWLRGRLEEAHTKYQQAMAISRQIAKPSLLASALRVDAHVLHDAGREAEARQELHQAEELRQTNHEALALAETKLSGVTFNVDLGEDAALPSRLSELLEIFKSKDDTDDEVAVQLAWTKYLLQRHELSEAQLHFRAAELTIHKAKNDSLATDAVPVRALLLSASGDHAGARRLLKARLAKAQVSGNVAAQMEFMLLLVQVCGDLPMTKRKALTDRYTAQATSAGFLRIARQMQAVT